MVIIDIIHYGVKEGGIYEVMSFIENAFLVVKSDHNYFPRFKITFFLFF